MKFADQLPGGSMYTREVSYGIFVFIIIIFDTKIAEDIILPDIMGLNSINTSKVTIFWIGFLVLHYVRSKNNRSFCRGLCHPLPSNRNVEIAKENIVFPGTS